MPVYENVWPRLYNVNLWRLYRGKIKSYMLFC